MSATTRKLGWDQTRRLLPERSELRAIGWVALGLVVLTAAVGAIALLVAGGASLRRELDYSFPGPRPSLGYATGIYGTNARVALLLIACCLVARMAWTIPGRKGAPDGRAPVAPRVLAGAAALVLVALNVHVIGVAYAAYGWRMVSATATHGPFELGAYAILLARLVECVRTRVELSAILRSALWVFVLLAAGALAETFGALG